jgi:nuclear pore complex protein Nup98-Nup96
VYASEEGAALKPPVGEGLNSLALVTLYNVHKRKASSGEIVTDPIAVTSYERRLKRYCGEMGARFLSYRADGGVWKFEVGGW